MWKYSRNEKIQQKIGHNFQNPKILIEIEKNIEMTKF